MVYKFKDVSPIIRANADPQKIGEELEGLETKTPQNIVDFARDSSTELHKCFTWDDSTAARKYRLSEARKIMEVIVTYIPREENPPMVVRAFQSVRVNNIRQYMPVAVVFSDESLRTQVFKDLKKGIHDLQKKVEDYEYLSRQEMRTLGSLLHTALKTVDSAK